MKLGERLDHDMKQAMRAREKFKLSVIRMVRSAIQNVEIDRKQKLNDDQISDILLHEIKQRKDALQEFQKAGRNDLVENAEQELDILAAYMPQPLTESELIQIVTDSIQQTGASGPADMGKVMSVIMPLVKGRADGKLVNQCVLQQLNS